MVKGKPIKRLPQCSNKSGGNKVKLPKPIAKLEISKYILKRKLLTAGRWELQLFLLENKLKQVNDFLSLKYENTALKKRFAGKGEPVKSPMQKPNRKITGLDFLLKEKKILAALIDALRFNAGKPLNETDIERAFVSCRKIDLRSKSKKREP
ncbi:MAG: hypothetical protein V1494_00420 [Candidatus Diapherotrites archaeon]